MNMEEQQMAYNSDSGEEQVDIEGISDDINMVSMGWISWFCSLEGHEHLVEIEEDFIKDPSNLCGLTSSFSREKFKACQKMVLSPHAPSDEDLGDE